MHCSSRSKRPASGSWPTWRRRRRALSIQIEQLRAARDEMAASVQGVRGSDGRNSRPAWSVPTTKPVPPALAAGDQARLHLPKDVPHDQEAVGDGESDGSDQQGEAPGDAPPAARRPRSTNCSPASGRHPTTSRASDGATGASADGHVATAVVIDVDEEIELEDR